MKRLALHFSALASGGESESIGANEKEDINDKARSRTREPTGGLGRGRSDPHDDSVMEGEISISTPTHEISDTPVQSPSPTNRTGHSFPQTMLLPSVGDTSEAPSIGGSTNQPSQLHDAQQP